MTRYGSFVRSFVVTGLMACAPPDPVAVSRQAIEGGVLDTSTPERDAVGMLALGEVTPSSGPTPQCTETFVTPSVFLTAEHCDPEAPTETPPATWQQVRYPAYADLVAGGNRADTEVSGRARVCARNTISDGVHDVVLFRVGRRVGIPDGAGRLDIAIAPMRVLTAVPGGADAEAFFAGQPVEIIGFGTNTPGAFLQRRTAPSTIVTTIVAGFPGYHQLALTPTGLPPINNGDSGGPTVWTDPSSGTRYLVGVHSTREGYETSTFQSLVGSWFRVALDPDNDGVLIGEQEIDPALDVDHDGLLSSDNCPGRTNADQLDSDCDGAGDECDLCPFDASLRPTMDSDGDGFGDGCDLCPLASERGCSTDADCATGGGHCDPTFGTHGRCAAERDGDGDGVPDVCDTCPTDAVPSQRDCNAEIEHVVHPSFVGPGDLCDATPCPLTVMPANPDESPPHFETNAFVEVTGVAPGDGLVKQSWTRHRFCPCAGAGATEDDRRQCARGSTEGGNLCLIDADMRDRLRPWVGGPGEHHWLRTTLRQVSATSTLGPAIEDPRYEIGYDSLVYVRGPRAPSIVWRWDFEADAARYGDWPLEDSDAFASVAGVTWSFAGDFDVSHVDAYTACQSETDGHAVACPAYDDAVSSYFTSGTTHALRVPVVLPPQRDLFIPIVAALIPLDACLQCEEHLPQPWLTTLPCTGPTCTGGDVLVQSGGVAEEAAVTQHLASALADPSIRWIAPSDVAYLRDLPRTRLVGVDVHGDVRARVVVLPSGALGLAGDSIKAPLSFVAGGVALEDARAGLPFAGFGAAFDARDGDVWVLGGADVNGNALGSAWRYDVDIDRWEPLPLVTGALGEVSSASMVADALALYAIDEVEHARSHVRRLVELDLRTGVARVLATSRGAAREETLAIRATPDGGFFLVEGSSRALRHRVVRYTRDLRPLGSAEGAGTPIGDPFVNTFGITIPVRLRDGHVTTVGHANADLDGRSIPALDELL